MGARTAPLGGEPGGVVAQRVHKPLEVKLRGLVVERPHKAAVLLGLRVELVDQPHQRGRLQARARAVRARGSGQGERERRGSWLGRQAAPGSSSCAALVPHL